MTMGMLVWLIWVGGTVLVGSLIVLSVESSRAGVTKLVVIKVAWNQLLFWQKGYRGVRRRTLAALKKLELVLGGTLCHESLMEARRLYDNVLPSLQSQIERIDAVLAMNVLQSIPTNSAYYLRAATAEGRLRELRADARRQSREIPELVASWIPQAGLAVASEQTAPAEALIREETERMEANLRAIEAQVQTVVEEVAQ